MIIFKQIKGYYKSKGNEISFTSTVARTRINGFMFQGEKKKFTQEVSAEKDTRNYFLRERIVKCGKWLPEVGED